jgi:hypothetical protein
MNKTDAIEQYITNTPELSAVEVYILQHWFEIVPSFAIVIIGILIFFLCAKLSHPSPVYDDVE